MTGDPVCPVHGFNPCRCREFVGRIDLPLQNGWLCPRCGSGNAPGVLQCPCNQPEFTINDDGTIQRNGKGGAS